MSSLFRVMNGLIGRVFLTIAAMVLGVSFSQAADHRDSPRITGSLTSLGNLDILDVYAFQSPTNRNNTVLIMTMSTDAGVLTPAYFSPYGVYEFKVLNQLTAGSFATDLTYQVAFSAPNASLQQTYTVTSITDATSSLIVKGVTNRKLAVKGGGFAQAGLFDDPFFFDLNAFNTFKAEALAGNPAAANVFLKRSNSNIPNNFFGGFNCIAIVLEVPSVKLQSSKANTSIGVWARTLVPGATFASTNPEQFDRKGRPAINTVLSPDAQKDYFNSNTPETDIQFRDPDKAELAKLFGQSDAYNTMLVDLLLPDVLTLKTKDADGFAKLNGRKLADDVIDIELGLLTNGAVTTDDVPNDSVFRNSFPYLGTPNPKAPSK